MNFIKKMFVHKHHFKRPIISMYKRISERYLIRECKCGKRQGYVFGVRDDTTPFPIPTNSIDSHTFNAILEGADYEDIGCGIIHLK